MQMVRKNVYFLLAVLLLTIVFTACTNPFDPLDKSDTIRGLTYIDFALTWDRWDSDPDGDGVVVSIEYFNTFNDSLDFHNKPTRVVIEFWTQALAGGVEDPDTGEITGGLPTNDKLIFSFPVVVDFSDADIRVPIEAYDEALAANYETFPEEAVSLFVLVRVFPPQDDPRPELVAFFGDMTVYEPPTEVVDPETVPEDPGTVPPEELPPVI
jgi:hypothetical protein